MDHLSFSDEPSVWTNLVKGAIALAIAFGWEVNDEQLGAIYTFMTLVAAVVIRQAVTPNKRVRSRKRD